MRDLLRILSFARPVGWLVPQYALLVIFAALFSVINLTILIPLLQVLFDQVKDSPEPVGDFKLSPAFIKAFFYSKLGTLIESGGKAQALNFICVLVAVSVLLANIFRYLSQLLLARVRVRVIQNLRKAAFSSLLGFELDYFVHHRKGDLISRITTDIQEVEQSAVNSLKVFFKEPFLLIGYFVALLAISAELTLYTFILVPAAGVAVSVIAKRVKKWSGKSQQSLGNIGALVDETINGMRVIKIFGAQQLAKKKFVDQVERYAQQTFKIATKSNLSGPISEVIGAVVLVLLLVIGGRMVIADAAQLSAATFIGFLVIFSQLLNPAKAMNVAISQINKGLAAAQRVFQLTDRPAHNSVQNKVRMPEVWQSISFNQVSFRYEEQAVVDKVNFTLEKGQLVALVGPSGSGKSTITDLLCQFYQPQVGSIHLDTINISNLDPAIWLKQIAVVSQDSILFNDSVYNNIAIGKPDATSDEVEKAAQIAYAHEFITQLESGYDTKIGEKGDRLSGGQKQRIAIARAVLKDAPILILDEATSALDSRSAEAVRHALANLMKGKTTLMIAHSISSVRKADLILVIDEGRIIERGTHDELLARSGLYQQLSALQSF